MKYLLLLFSLFICSIVSGQIENPIARNFFKDGVIAFNQSNFQAADSLFNLSVRTEPSLEAYYYRAISDSGHASLCEKCKENNVVHAPKKRKENERSPRGSQEECTETDTIIYPQASTPGLLNYCTIRIALCDSLDKVRYSFHQKDLSRNLQFSFRIEDSMASNKNPIASFPDLNQLSPDKVIYTVSEEMPEFPGEAPGMMKYLKENLNYPQEAYKNGISGMVYVTFVVTWQGDITNISILRGVEKSLDDEALRVMGLMPRWKPGKINGKPVSVQFNVPIRFNAL